MTETPARTLPPLLRRLCLLALTVELFFLVLPHAYRSATRVDTFNRPDMLLITLDLWPPDTLNRVECPTIEHLAEEGISFTHAYSLSTLTEYATRCMLTERYESQLLARQDPYHERHRNLASTLKQYGYDTGAFLGMFAFRAPAMAVIRHGFDTFNAGSYDSGDGHGYRCGAQTNLEALKWLSKQPGTGRPWFLWLMYWDMHFPDSMHLRPLPLGPQRRVLALVRYQDRCVKQVLDAVRAMHFNRNVVVVITANHGFGLPFLRDTTLRVPLVVWKSGWTPPRKRVRRPVSQIDVVPTILSLLGIPAPRGPGRSLLLPLRDQPVVYAETPALNGRCIRAGEWKYVQYLKNVDIPSSTYLALSPDPEGAPINDMLSIAPDPDRKGWSVLKGAGTEALYDLKNDPYELNNLARTQPSITTALREALAQWQYKNNRGMVLRPAIPGPRMLQLMRRNGYWPVPEAAHKPTLQSRQASARRKRARQRHR